MVKRVSRRVTSQMNRPGDIGSQLRLRPKLCFEDSSDESRMAMQLEAKQVDLLLDRFGSFREVVR